MPEDPDHASDPQLRSPQQRAIAYVAERSRPGPPVDPALRVCVHFHPDRVYEGEHILAIMKKDGVYRSQFETGTSNGGLTAYAGGDRWRWESRMFGGAYDDAEPGDRPRYGALNHTGRSIGPSPRFGSAHLRLAPHALAISTFCFPDSFHEPTDFGVPGRMGLVELAERAAGLLDPLDVYIEAHVHGAIVLGRDVEALVLDPSYEGTETERCARELGCGVEFHDGFAVSVDTVREHPEYRGWEFVVLAERIAERGVVTPEILGRAACSGGHQEQAVKKVWHYVARFGNAGLTPRSAPAP